MRVPSLQRPKGASRVGEGPRSRRGHWAEEEVVSAGSPVGEAGSSVLHNHEMLCAIPATFNVGTHDRTELRPPNGRCAGNRRRPPTAGRMDASGMHHAHGRSPSRTPAPTARPRTTNVLRGTASGTRTPQPLPRVKGGRVDRPQEAGDRIVLLPDFGGGYETPRTCQNSQDLILKSVVCCM